MARLAARGTVTLSLVGFVVANLGLPLVQPVASGPAKDRSKPFPCQNRPCGCMSAAQCMRSCCCFSAEYRLAWAARFGLNVPPELLLAATRDRGDHGDDDAHDADQHGAAHAQAASCCSKPATACTKYDDGHRDSADHHEQDQHRSENGWQIVVVVGSLASQCRGLGPNSPLTFSALPLPAALSYQFDLRVTDWFTVTSSQAESTSIAPLAPPPRAA